MPAASGDTTTRRIHPARARDDDEEILRLIGSLPSSPASDPVLLLRSGILNTEGKVYREVMHGSEMDLLQFTVRMLRLGFQRGGAVHARRSAHFDVIFRKDR